VPSMTVNGELSVSSDATTCMTALIDFPID
jgi:hypothetical protein